MKTFTPVTREESIELNVFISNIEEVDDTNKDVFTVSGLSQHGKVFPYIGWYWRVVDFTEPFQLGNCGQFVGFMENNKWCHPERTVTVEEYTQIITLLRTIKDNGATNENLNNFNKYIQTLEVKD